MAHTKAGGSTKLGRDSEAKRLGVKAFDKQLVKTGNVLIRQRGTKWYAGINTKMGADNTIYSLIDGKVQFTKKKKIDFTGHQKIVSTINVLPIKAKEQ